MGTTRETVGKWRNALEHANDGRGDGELETHRPSRADEKSQCRALERSQPMLPMNLGYVKGVRHVYVRHGTTTLFAALASPTAR